MSKAKFPQAYHDFEKSNGEAFVEFNREPSLTRQEFAEECDINTLMRTYNGHVIGGPGNMRALEPRYVDFADLPQDLMGYLEFMKEAEASFMSLPAIVRKEFDNNAMQFVEYASDPSSLDQMRAWGLAPPVKAPEPPQSEPPPQATPVAGDAPKAS